MHWTDDVTRNSGPERPQPPGWARSPGTLRSRRWSPFPPEPSSSRATAPGPGPALVQALARLQPALSLTAGLLVAAPLVDLALGTLPAVPADPGWRLAVAAGLPSSLLLPCLGALLFSVLAVALPSRLATALALASVALGVTLAGFAAGTLAYDVLATARAGGAPGLWQLWPPLLGLWLLAAHLGIGWGLLREQPVGMPPLGLPGLHRLGIDLLD